MQTTPAIVRAVSLISLLMLSHPKPSSVSKIRQVRSNVATVIPEIGFDDEPISPVRREATVTNKNPKTTIIIAATRPVNPKPKPSCGTAIKDATRIRLAVSTNGMGKSVSVRSLRAPWPDRLETKSRKLVNTAPRITGMALIMLRIPPAATAPAPM